MFFATSRPWRSACCAVGGHGSPGRAASGTAAQSPIAHTPSWPTTRMLAFHNDPSIKAEYLSRVAEHAAADQIIHGTYWMDGKGCAVGCTIHGSI